MRRAHAPGLGHARPGCTSSDPPQAGQQAKFIHAQTSRDTCDPCHHSETTTSSHSVTKESLTALPGPTSNGIPVTHTVSIHSFFLFLIYNPPLHLVVSSLSIASCALCTAFRTYLFKCALHFAPIFQYSECALHFAPIFSIFFSSWSIIHWRCISHLCFSSSRALCLLRPLDHPAFRRILHRSSSSPDRLLPRLHLAFHFQDPAIG